MQKTTHQEPEQGKETKLTLMQKPNPPIIVALLAAVIAAFAAEYPQVYAVALAVAVVSFTAWTWWEATSGINWLRKLLGWIGLIAVIVYLYFQFV